MTAKSILGVLLVSVSLLGACAHQPKAYREFLGRPMSSVGENSCIELVAHRTKIVKGKKILRQIFVIDLKITNTSSKPYVTPEDVIILDANKNSLRLLRADEAIYYLNGAIPEDYLAASQALSWKQLPLYQSYTTTGTFLGNTYTGYTHPPGYGLNALSQGINQGVNNYARLALAARAARLRQAVLNEQLLSLKPAKTLPSSINKGRIFCMVGTLPIEVHIFTCGDHHIVKVER